MRGIDTLRVIRNNKDPYTYYPVFGNERFYLRRITDEDAVDLLKVYSDKESLNYFNSDNCNGDDFHYTTIAQMKKTMDFWEHSYQNRYFVRWAIYDKETKTVIGTIEQFHRDSNDHFNNCSLLRLDLRSDYEKKDIIINILKLIVPSSFNLFKCGKVVTKSFYGNIERENALYELGFKESKEALIGHNHEHYYGYWELTKT
ncbi:MAG: GNAT family N-acetyltransferase [Clostridiales bacterium]|nr:GNAT family N-acetyltransferase [Clostridiales bacterium]